MATIEVRQTASEGPSVAFEVTIDDGRGRTTYQVTAASADLSRLATQVPPARAVEAAFRFLLDREPKESILRRFDLSGIGHYFPEFERELPAYLNPNSG